MRVFILVHDQSQTRLHVGFIHHTMMSTMSIRMKKNQLGFRHNLGFIIRLIPQSPLMHES